MVMELQDYIAIITLDKEEALKSIEGNYVVMINDKMTEVKKPVYEIAVKGINKHDAFHRAYETGGNITRGLISIKIVEDNE